MVKAREFGHILGSMILLSIAVGAVFTRTEWFAAPFTLTAFGALLYPTMVAFFALGISFAAHEISHRWITINYGGKAEYRANWFSLSLTIIVAAFLGILFAAPGGVYVYGIRAKDRMGRIALAGPLANLLLIPAFLPISTIGGFLGDVGVYGVLINAALALFNMIPVDGLDGRKVWRWNKGVWAVFMVVAFIAWYVILWWLTWV